MLIALLLAAQGLDWFPGTSSIRDAEVFPPAFHGVWSPNQESCLDPVWQLTVMRDGADTYESGGRLRRITQEGSERTVLALMEWEGEGTIWEAFHKMSLSSDGNRLTLDDADKPGDPIEYVRCQGSGR